MENVYNYLNNSFKCKCGREHTIPIKEVLIEEGALKQVPAVISELTEKKIINIICDKNTHEAAGARLNDHLTEKDFATNIIILPAPEEKKVEPNTDYLFQIMEQVSPEGYILACGSGTINDLTKYVSFKMSKPYSVVATAPSMDGYSSPVSPITAFGVKGTYHAQSPEAIIGDLDVLTAAPEEMIRSGLGDMLGKISSQLDWRLSNILFEEYYCPVVGEMLLEELAVLMDLNLDLNGPDRKKAVEILFHGLIKSGLAMLMVDTSRPASGTEHHVAHFLEMYSVMYDRNITGHGLNVGMGEYFAARYYLRLQDLDFSQLKVENNREERTKNIKKYYKDRADFALKNLDQRFKKTRVDEKKLHSKEREIKNLIAEYRPFLNKIEHKLLETRILSREYLGKIPEDWLIKAVKYGFEIRTRFTAAVLLKQLGLLDYWVDEFFEDFKLLTDDDK